MEKIKDYLPIFAIIITIASSLYTYSYYKVVSVNIFSYLDASEIILLQFKLLVQTGFLLLVILLSSISYFATMARLFAPKEVELEIEPDEISGKNKVELATEAATHNIASWLKHPFVSLKILIIFTLIIWAIHLLFLYKSPVLFPTFAAMGKIGIIAIMFALFKRHISVPFSKLYAGKFFSNRPLADDIEKMMKELVFIEMIILGALITGLAGQIDMYDTLLGTTSNSATIILENKTISTSDTLIYIGRTRNFIFLYHKIKEEAQIIPADKIIQLDLRTGKENFAIPPTYRNSKFFKPFVPQTKNKSPK